MYIKNVGIFVKDLEGAKAFFEDYFGAKVLKTYNEPQNGYYSYVMELDDTCWLELMTKPSVVDIPKDPNRLGYAHICICTETAEQRNDILDRFQKDGYRILYRPSNPQGIGDGRAVTFEDLVIEVYYGG